MRLALTCLALSLGVGISAVSTASSHIAIGPTDELPAFPTAAPTEKTAPIEAAPPVAVRVGPSDLFPARTGDGPTGTAFADQVAGMTDHERYAAASAQVLAGNVPNFLRTLVPVTLSRPAGVDSGPEQVTVFVTPDYLSVGNDQDFLTVPLDFLNAATVADALGFGLPTTRIVDAVYTEAALHLAPIPLPAGPQMRSMAYIREHFSRVTAERDGRAEGALIAGTQKDLVLTERLRSMPGREAIYGWHQLNGRPIQPLSLVHGVEYADYSHGIRLVADTVLVDGQPTSYLAALSDPAVAPMLNREGPIPDAAALMHPATLWR